MPGKHEHRQRRDVADEVHAARHAAGADQVDGVEQQAAHGPESTGAGPGHAVVEAQAETLGKLPFLLDRGIGIQRRLGCTTEQQVHAAGEDDDRQHLVQPFGRQVVGGHGTDRRTYQCADQCTAPLGRMEQLASVKRIAGRRRAEGRAEFVGAQYQVRRQAGGQQGWRGEQATATGDGIDEAGDKGHGGENGEGGQVDAEFKGHGGRAVRKAAYCSCKCAFAVKDRD
ncbi:hypothetical protein D3C84_651950 [compost metagenome]